MNKRSTPRRTSAAEERGHFHGKRVVIVDDHPLIRRGLERMIHSSDDFIVCGEAGTAEQGLTVIREQQPDLAIIDIGLPGRDGIELARDLMKEFPKLAVLILSMHEEADYARRALQAGARGYMVKHDAVEGISTALGQVLRGELYLSPGIRGTVTLPAPKRKPPQTEAKKTGPNASAPSGRGTGSIRSGRHAAPSI